jgi:hypothetical protein
MRFLSYFFSLLVLVMVSACGGGGGSPGLSSTNKPVDFFTTAPATLKLPIGTSASFPVTGGTLPYSVVTNMVGYIDATVTDGVLKISAIKATADTTTSGTTSSTTKFFTIVSVSDALGKKLDVAVEVPETVVPVFSTTAPTSLTLAAGSAVSYPISGGVAPYTVVTDSLGLVSASINQSILNFSAISAGTVAVVVSDSMGTKLTYTVIVPQPAALFTTAQSSITLASGLVSTYSVSGGSPPYRVTSNNTDVVMATVSGSNGQFLDIKAVATGAATVQVADAKGANLTISVTVPAPASLFTTAPAALTLVPGASSEYLITGGMPPYVANSSNATVVSATASGSKLTLGALAGGSAPVLITDAKGASITVTVTVSTIPLTSTSPSAVTIAANSVTNLYSISGGTPPYSARSSDESVATASVPLGTTGLVITGLSGGAATVVVTDSKGAVLNIAVTVPAPNALYSTAPASITMAIGASGSYTIAGGTAPYSVSSSDAGAVRASVAGNSLSILAASGGTSTVKITDNKGGTISLSVTVGSSTALFVNSPAVLALGVGSTASYQITGGTAPYTVTAGDGRVAIGSVNGATLSVSAAKNGATTLFVFDSAGASKTISVNVGDSTSAAVTVNAPSPLAMAGGTTASYLISGGTAPYNVSSSDGRIASALVSSTTLTINAIKSGTVTLFLFDANGASKTLTVNVDGNSGTGAATTVDIFASSSTLASAPGSKVTFTVNVKDGLNTAVPNQTVSFSATNGGTLFGANPSPVTDASGTIATVSLSPGADSSNRSIVVVAAIGAVSKSITIPVTGTTLSLSGVGSALAGTAATPFTVKALDSGGKPISGATLSISSTAGNGISPTTVVTDVAGSANVSFTPSVAGTDTVKVSGLGTSAQATVVVSNEDFSFLAPAAGAKLDVNIPSTVTACYKVGGIGVAGQAVTFSTTRGTLGAAVVSTVGVTVPQTIPVGCATTTVTSTTAGPVTVSAQLALPSTARTSSTAMFVARVPTRIDLQANPGSLAPNSAGATTNQSALTATVRDASGNPVSDVTVNFTATSDLSNGTISPGSTTTDSNGIATVQFIPGGLTTATNGVALKAALPAFPTVFATANLTVSGQSLFISIGVASDLVILDSTTYQKNFTAYLTDASGAPSANRTVTLSVIPTQYGKGSLVYDTANTVWTYSATSPTNCANEDSPSYNGILEAGEDINGDGRLTPGLPVVVSPASVTTDASGYAKFALLYGKNFAWWLDSQITARASVGGTESKQLSNYPLELDANTAKATSKPPNQTSPFGTATVCTNPN